MTPIINVQNLTKEFILKKKTSGVLNYFKTMFSKGTTFTAVKNVNFTINKGELVELPVELLTDYSTQLLLIYTGATIIIFTIALLIYNYGIKKYESGNMIGIRV